jgi:hypothetical protein
MPQRKLDLMNDRLKGARVKTKHLGYWQKVKGFGASARDYKFDLNRNDSGPSDVITLQQYFDRTYPGFCPLKFPTLPSIDFGSKGRANLVPAELVIVPGGQSRSKSANSPDIVAQLIKKAAVKPDERFKFITNGDAAGPSIIGEIKTDKIAEVDTYFLDT